MRALLFNRNRQSLQNACVVIVGEFIFENNVIYQSVLVNMITNPSKYISHSLSKHNFKQFPQCNEHHNDKWFDEVDPEIKYGTTTFPLPG